MLLYALALAAHAATLGVLEIPYTPSDGKDEYATLVPVKGGTNGTTWTSSAKGFTCSASGDYVLVRITPETWPTVIPKKVRCTEDGGKRKADAKVHIRKGNHHSMFVDGILVMPREKHTSAIYRGPALSDDVIVGPGQSETLGVTCKVEAGPVLVVAAGSENRDGSGRCSLKTRSGQAHWVKIKIVTVKPK